VIRFLFVVLLFLGCAGNKQPKIPSWYLKPLGEDYATGSGYTKKEAVFNALSNFVAKYGVGISSSLDINKKNYSGGLYLKNSAYSLKAEVSKIEISDYRVVKVYPYKYRFLVLVKVDKKRLFNRLKSSLDERFKGYKEQFLAIKKENSIKQLIDLKNLLKELEKEKRYIKFLKALNPSFNQKPYMDFIEDVKQQFIKLKHCVKIEIECNNFAIKKDIEKYLNEHDIKVSKSPLKLKVKVIKKSSKGIINLDVYNIYTSLSDNTGTNHFKIVVPKNTDISGYFYDEVKNMDLEKFFGF
jgi:hypothetical protein